MEIHKHIINKRMNINEFLNQKKILKSKVKKGIKPLKKAQVKKL